MLARAECAEGEVYSPVTLASLNHYFCPVSCVYFHVHVVIYMCVHCSKFHRLAYGGECAIRVYLVDWDSFQQTCCYTWPFSCLLIVRPISSSCIPSSANSHCLIFYMYLSIIFLSCYLEEEGSRQINIHIQTDSTDRLSSLTPPPPHSLSKAYKHANMVGYIGRAIICETNRVQPQIIRRCV